MPCERYTAQLAEYLEGTLRAAEAAHVEAHLQQCADCRAELDDWRRTRAVLAEAPLPGPGPDEPDWTVFEARVLAHVRDETAARPRSFRAWLMPAGLATAAAALVLTFGSAPRSLPEIGTGTRPAAMNAAAIERLGEEMSLAWEPAWQWNVDAVLADMDADALDALPLLLAQALTVDTTAGAWQVEAVFSTANGEWLDAFDTLDQAAFESFVTQLEQPTTS